MKGSKDLNSETKYIIYILIILNILSYYLLFFIIQHKIYITLSMIILSPYVTSFNSSVFSNFFVTWGKKKAKSEPLVFFFPPKIFSILETRQLLIYSLYL